MKEPQLGSKQKLERRFPAQSGEGTKEQDQRKRQKSTQPHKNSLTQPPSFTWEYHSTLFPEKIYLSILLEPRKNNNILHEKETQISHPLGYVLGSARKLYFSKSFLEEAALERAKVISREV